MLLPCHRRRKEEKKEWKKECVCVCVCVCVCACAQVCVSAFVLLSTGCCFGSLLYFLLC